MAPTFGVHVQADGELKPLVTGKHLDKARRLAVRAKRLEPDLSIIVTFSHGDEYKPLVEVK